MPPISHLIALFSRHDQTFFIPLVSGLYPLSHAQIHRYQDFLHWNERNNKVLCLSTNTAINWTPELLEQYKNKIDWFFFSHAILAEHLWYDGIIDDYIDYIDWYSISYNKHITWTEDMIDRYKDKIDWKSFSHGAKLNWSKDMINKYAHLLDFHHLSRNSHAPWNNLNTYLYVQKPTNSTILEALPLLEKLEHKLNWEFLSFDWTHGLTPSQSNTILTAVLENSHSQNKLHP